MRIVAPHNRALADQQRNSTSVIRQSDGEAYAAYVALSDSDLERWFSRHRSELVNLANLDMVPIAAWLPAIGPPANDNAHLQHPRP